MAANQPTTGEKCERNSPSDWREYTRPTWTIVVVLVILAVHIGLALSAASRKSVTFDELSYLATGYSYWHTGDYRLQPESGNLPQRWAAIPLLFSNVKYPTLEQPAWWFSAGPVMAMQFFYDQGNDVDMMLWRGRCMMVVLSALLGLSIFFWSRHLFGTAGAVISLTVFALSPTFLANGPLVVSDVALSFGVMVFLGCLWISMHWFSRLTLMASGIALGVLLVTKMSAVVVFPLAAALWALREWRRKPLVIHDGHATSVQSFDERLRYWGISLLSHALVALLVMWTFYGFQGRTFRHAKPGRDVIGKAYQIRGIEEEGILGAAVKLTSTLHVVPQPYLQGFSKIVRRTKTRRAFLNGEYRRTGWKSFFPYCFLHKTPWPIFVLIAAAVGTQLWKTQKRPIAEGENDHESTNTECERNSLRRMAYHGAPLWAFFVLYWMIAITSNINIGHRHLMPTYPILFVFLGAVGYWFRPWRWMATVPTLAILAWLSVETLTAWPHYLAYYNPSAGGPSNAYRHLVDSSLDWGQDLRGLKRWLDDEATRQNKQDISNRVYISYFGTGKRAYYGIEGHFLPSFAIWPDEELQFRQLQGGTYCISATMLQSIYLSPFGRWNDRYEAEYHELLNSIPKFQQWQNQNDFLDNTPTARKQRATLKRFLELRFCRLCAFLRQREPDDRIGYSIHIYRLTDADVAQALNGPPAELDIVSPDPGEDLLNFGVSKTQ